MSTKGRVPRARGRAARRRWACVAWALGATLAVVTSGMAAAAAPKRATDIGGPFEVRIKKSVPGSQQPEFDFHVCAYFSECYGAEQFPIPANGPSVDWNWGDQLTLSAGDEFGTAVDTGSLPVQITELISAEQYEAGWRFVSAKCSTAEGFGAASSPYVPAPATAAAEAGGMAMSILVQPPGNSCTFKNARGGLIVVKDASIDDPQDFSFTWERCSKKSVEAAAESPDTACGRGRKNGGSFTLDDHPPGNPPNIQLLTFETGNVGGPGVFLVREKAPPSGWFLESITCPGRAEDDVLVQLAKRRVFVRVRFGEFPYCVFRNAASISADDPLPQVPVTGPPPPPTVGVPPGGGTPGPASTTTTTTSTTTTTRPRG